MTKYVKMHDGKTIEVTAHDHLLIATVSENSKENGYSYAYFSLGGVDTYSPLWGGTVSVISTGKNAADCLRVAIETGMSYKGVLVI